MKWQDYCKIGLDYLAYREMERATHLFGAGSAGEAEMHRFVVQNELAMGGIKSEDGKKLAAKLIKEKHN